MRRNIYELSGNNITENIINDLIKIHNENFERKVEHGYFKDILSNTLYTVYCITESESGEKERKVSGYVIYYDTFDSFDLFEITVDKKFQNKGAGNELLVNSLFMLSDNEKYRKRENKEKAVFLEVDENNSNAVRLYRKNNFKEISIRKNYYGTGQNAIIMKKE